jgi:16S rRNA (uracil1498-N3)-methyltransferase
LDRVFLPAACFASGEVRIAGSPHRHLARSLRVRSGDRFLATDGEGREYLLEAAEVQRHELVGRVVSESESPPGPGARLSLAIAPPKQGRMEIAVEKVVECGVGRIVPIRAARSVVRTRDGSARGERWRRVAQSATAQSGRVHLPEIAPIQSLSSAYRGASSGRIVVAHPGPGACSMTNALAGLGPEEEVTIFVGPEGGFTADEVEEGRRFGAAEVSLGPNRLRTETAAIVAATLALAVLTES